MFLVGAFIIKRARLLQPLDFLRQTRSAEIIVQFVQINIYLLSQPQIRFEFCSNKYPVYGEQSGKLKEKKQVKKQRQEQLT